MNVVVDGHNLAFRVHHALPPLTSENGEDTRVLYGFLSSLPRYLDLAGPGSRLYVAWDGGSHRRKALDPQYKANRNGSTSSGWLTMIQSFLPLIGVDQLLKKGEEADDVIATFTSKSESPSLVVTQDRDLLSLVTDRVAVAIPGAKGVVQIYDPEKVLREYGVLPEEFPLWLAIVGDPSDNIKGVLRFPSKVAANLAHTYKDVDAVFSSGFPGLTRKQYVSIKDGENLVRSNLHLTRLVFDVDYDTISSAINMAKAEEVLTSYGFDPKVLKPFQKSRQGFLKFS